MKKLLKVDRDGMPSVKKVLFARYGEMDDGGKICCYHGWILTKLAKEKYAEKYDALQQAEYERINRLIDEDEESDCEVPYE